MTIHLTDPANRQKAKHNAKILILFVMRASFFLPTQFCNWNFKMYFWLRVQKSFIELFFCIIVKYIFHFPIVLPFLHSKHKKSCWKQLNLALKHKLCFHNTFCPAKQLVVMHLLQVLLGIFYRRILGFGQRCHSTSAMWSYLAHKAGVTWREHMEVNCINVLTALVIESFS